MSEGADRAMSSEAPSRGAAEVISPGREPWVSQTTSKAPRAESARSGRQPTSVVSSGRSHDRAEGAAYGTFPVARSFSENEFQIWRAHLHRF